MLAVSPQQSLDELLATAEDRLSVPKSVTAALKVQPPSDARRRFVRTAFTRRAVLELGQSMPSIERAPGCFVILTRDLSRSGIGFLHAFELYPGERVKLWLPTGPVASEVARCRRHDARCYEVGVRFARASDV
jgi:hypothetical protein